MHSEESAVRHHSILEKLGLAQWSAYDLATISRTFVERTSRHLVNSTYDVAGLSIACHAGLYHPDVNSSSVFILRHLADPAFFPSQPVKLLEIGTGTGAVILALQKFLNAGSFTGLDIDPASVACAQANAVRNGLHTRFLQSDLFSGVSGERFDVILFNLPMYGGDIEGELDPQLEGKLCDFRGEILQRFVDDLPHHLTQNGCAYLTISNTGHLAALDRPGLDLEVIAFERFSNGFLRILIRLTCQGEETL